MLKPIKAILRLETFGEVLQKKRFERNLDLDKLAEKSSVNALTIDKIEKGGNTTMITILKVADAMNVDLSRLFDEMEKKHRGF